MMVAKRSNRPKRRSRSRSSRPPGSRHARRSYADARSGGNRRVWALIRRYEGKNVRYADLPRPAQMAIAHYMVVDSDGAAWGEKLPEWTDALSVPQLKARLPELLPYLTQRYGGKLFGLVRIPMTALAQSIMQDEDMSGFKSFDDYSRAFVRQNEMPRHGPKDMWPVILDTNNDFETLQDGWHRLHRYFQLGATSVPAVYYLPRVKYS
jgi:hypothetical protein